MAGQEFLIVDTRTLITLAQDVTGNGLLSLFASGKKVVILTDAVKEIKGFRPQNSDQVAYQQKILDWLDAHSGGGANTTSSIIRPEYEYIPRPGQTTQALAAMARARADGVVAAGTRV